MDESEKHFIAGVAFSASYLIKVFDQPGIAIDLIKEAGYGLKHLEEAECDEGDLEVIKKHWK